jgi:DNA-directed RNA polymerase specialized sigma24 family protein
MNLPAPWDLYRALQIKLLKGSKVDDASWGCEAALNRILRSDLARDPPVSNEDINRWARSESRRERHRASLRRLRLTHLEVEHPAIERALHERQELRKARELVTDEEWTLLCAVSEGRGYDEIATRTGRSSGALRIRILRLRHRLSAALAA